MNADLSAEFTGPAVGVAMMAGSFMNPRLVVDADYNNVSDNLVASTLFSVLNNTEYVELRLSCAVWVACARSTSCQVFSSPSKAMFRPSCRLRIGSG